MTNTYPCLNGFEDWALLSVLICEIPYVWEL